MPTYEIVCSIFIFSSHIRGLHLNMFPVFEKNPLSYIQAKVFFPEKDQQKIFPLSKLVIKILREGGYFHLQGTCIFYYLSIIFHLKLKLFPFLWIMFCRNFPDFSFRLDHRKLSNIRDHFGTCHKLILLVL